MEPFYKLTSFDYVRIAAAGFLDPRSVRRAYEGKPCAATTRARVCHGAQTLGLPLPPNKNSAATESA